MLGELQRHIRIELDELYPTMSSPNSKNRFGQVQAGKTCFLAYISSNDFPDFLRCRIRIELDETHPVVKSEKIKKTNSSRDKPAKNMAR